MVGNDDHKSLDKIWKLQIDCTLATNGWSFSFSIFVLLALWANALHFSGGCTINRVIAHWVEGVCTWKKNINPPTRLIKIDPLSGTEQEKRTHPIYSQWQECLYIRILVEGPGAKPSKYLVIPLQYFFYAVHTNKNPFQKKVCTKSPGIAFVQGDRFENTKHSENSSHNLELESNL